MADEIIAHPTYMEHIRHFFREIDLDHMNSQGVDLSTYAQLTAARQSVFAHAAARRRHAAGGGPEVKRETVGLLP